MLPSHSHVPALSELTISCDKPSQELLTLPRSKYALCASYGGTAEGARDGSEADAGEVFEEVEEEEGCRWEQEPDRWGSGR